jgi:hypothetical protein
MCSTAAAVTRAALIPGTLCGNGRDTGDERRRRDRHQKGVSQCVPHRKSPPSSNPDVRNNHVLSHVRRMSRVTSEHHAVFRFLNC